MSVSVRKLSPGRLGLLSGGLKGHRRRRPGTNRIPRTDEHVVGGVGLKQTEIDLVPGGVFGE